jgi:hypothetical protein
MHQRECRGTAEVMTPAGPIRRSRESGIVTATGVCALLSDVQQGLGPIDLALLSIGH